MIRNYLKIAFRNLLRFKVYTIINLFGLAIGLTVGVLILIFVNDELSFDKFHAKADRIYKVTTANPSGEGMETNAWPIAHKLRTEFPEVESVVYTRRASSLIVNYEDQRYEHKIFYAGDDFFNIFSFDLIEGDPAKALIQPFSIVITEQMKARYFSQEVVLGKTLILRDSLEFTITGVVKDVPSQSHIQFDMLASFSSYEKLIDWFSYSEGWGNFNVRNYVLLKEGASIDQLESKAVGLYMDNVGDWLKEMGMEFYVDFVPMSDIYLKSNYSNGFGPKGSMDKVYLVAAIAIFVILLACINFVNITTARSVYRAKEVGLRKVVGSTRIVLFWQFFIEAFIITLLAFACVALLIDFTLPFFNEMMGKNYDLTSLLNLELLSYLFISLIAITFLSGFYPAIVLSGFKPVEVLKGRLQSSAKGVRLRRGLVIFQFIISAGLVLSTLVVLSQLDYMRNQDLGFNKEQILVLNTTRVPQSASHDVFKQSIRSIAGVENVSFANALPGRPGWLGQWAYPEKMQEGAQVDTEYMAIDEEYIATMGLEIIAGNNFDINNKAELEEGLIINETTVRKMGWESPEDAIGKKIVSPSQRPAGTVIGVVKDYHDLSLQNEIWPMAMDYASAEYGRYYAIQFSTGQTSELLNQAQNLWEENLGDYTFEYFFLDEDFDRQYQSENQLMKVFVVFAILTIIIASIGLLGLVSFMVSSRTKEIGIRKVMGASSLRLARLLSKEFVFLVVIANGIVIPFVWIFGNQWLENFAFHTTIEPTIFIVSLLITVCMATLTVSYQTLRAAYSNPVDVLKDE